MAKQVSTKPISKKRKFVKDGIFYAELNDFLARELAENGYAGCEVRVTPKRTEVTIRATQVLQVVGENGRRIRELTALVQKRFRFPKKGIFMYAEKIQNKGLSALAQAQAVKFRLLQGLSVRRAAYSVVQFIMNKEAKGCEVIVSGKLRGQRAKGMKFKDGYMIHAGDAVNYYIDEAVKHVHLRQGVIGIKVKIMLPHDPNGVKGVARDLPDSIKIHDIVDKEPSEDEEEQKDDDINAEDQFNDDNNQGDDGGDNMGQFGNNDDDNNDGDNDMGGGGGNFMESDNQFNQPEQPNQGGQMPPQNMGFGQGNDMGQPQGSGFPQQQFQGGQQSYGFN